MEPRIAGWPERRAAAVLIAAATFLCTVLTAMAGEPSAPVSLEKTTDSKAASAPLGFDPAEHVGQVVYLDFWASWCAPCKHSFPWMKELQAQYGTRGFEVIAINLDKKRAAADEFLKQATPNFSIMFDPEGKLAKQYQLQGMPTTLLFDREGKLQHTHIGYREGDRETLANEIEALLAAPRPEPTHAQ